MFLDVRRTKEAKRSKKESKERQKSVSSVSFCLFLSLCGCPAVHPLCFLPSQIMRADTQSSICWARALSEPNPTADGSGRTQPSGPPQTRTPKKRTSRAAQIQISEQFNQPSNTAGMTALSSWELCVKYALFIFNFVFWVSWKIQKIIDK